MAAKPVIVVIGSINMDLVVECARLPTPGETIAGGRFATIPGGKGANQAVAAARLGAETYMVGRVGDDAFGQLLRSGLEENSVDTRHVKTTARTASGTATIVVQKGGENSIILSPGANGAVTPADIDAAAPMIKRASAVLLQLEIPQSAVKRAIELCRKYGVTSVLDPAPAPSESLPKALYKVDVISPNETEAAILLKLPRATPEAVSRKLLARGAGNVVLKLGRHGAMHTDSSHVMTQIAGFKVKVVDTTAAGDSFTAGLAVARAEGRSWADAIRFANAAGALACTAFGAQPSIPRRRDVAALMKANKPKAG